MKDLDKTLEKEDSLSVLPDSSNEINAPDNNSDNSYPEQTPTLEEKPQSEKGDSMKTKRKALKIVGLVFAFLIVILAVSALPALNIYNSARVASEDAKKIMSAAKIQDLDGIKKNIPAAKNSLKKVQDSLGFFSFTSFIPFFGNYYKDADHLIKAADYGYEAMDIGVEMINPYADILGFKGKGSFSGGGAAERMQKAIQTLDKVEPQLDKIAPKLTQIKNELDSVNPDRYPEAVGSFRVKSQLSTVKGLIDQVESLIVDARPAVRVLPSILGQPEPKTYLILFQNDKELRPSGGFLTAYSYVRVDKGKISAAGSDDIYHLDERLHQVCLRRVCNLTPPAPIVYYLPEPDGKPKTSWDSRDSNLSPDWKLSAQEFERFYNIIGGQKIDGIISIDTYVVRDLLAVTGPLGVAGYLEKFTKDNVVNELENYSTYIFRNQAGRKAVLGDLMHSILLTILQSGKDKFQPLIQTGLNLAAQKHVMVYFHDEKAQEAAEKFNWAGRLKSYDGDYLHVNDANFASAKANMYVKEQVGQKVEVSSDGTVTKTLTLTYSNPGPVLELNPFYRDWVRVFVPKGSKLLSSEGSNNRVASSEDLDKTVFDTFFYINAGGGKRTITIKYELPFKVKKGTEYKLLIQKQPGTEGHEYFLEITGGSKFSQKFNLTEDKEIKVKI